MKRGRPSPDLTGQRYGKLRVVYVAGHRATVCGLEAPRSAADQEPKL